MPERSLNNSSFIALTMCFFGPFFSQRRSSPLPFPFSGWIINRSPSSLAAAKAVSKLAFCPRAAQAWVANRLSRLCLPSSSLSVPLCARGVSLCGDGNRWTNVWSTHLWDILSPQTRVLYLSSPILPRPRPGESSRGNTRLSVWLWNLETVWHIFELFRPWCQRQIVRANSVSK